MSQPPRVPSLPVPGQQAQQRAISDDRLVFWIQIIVIRPEYIVASHAHGSYENTSFHGYFAGT